MNLSAQAGLGFRAALGLLTIIPAGQLGELVHLRDRDPALARRIYGWAMGLAPVATLPLALGAGVLGGGARWVGLTPLLAAVLVIAMLAWATRAMHLDALADTADGLGAGWHRERALEVMRLGDIGPMGAATLVLVLLGQVAAAATLLTTPRGGALIAAAVLTSRVSLAWLARRGVPAARPDGLGAMVAGSVAAPWAVGAWVAAGAIFAGAAHWVGLGWAYGLGAVLAAWVAALLVERVARRTLGGITGDVLGAAVELAFVAALIVASAGWA